MQSAYNVDDFEFMDFDLTDYQDPEEESSEEEKGEDLRKKMNNDFGLFDENELENSESI